MVEALLTFLIVLLVVGFIVWLACLLIDRAPIDATFKQVGKAVVILVGVIILVLRLIPLLSSLA
jgi:hypothetical protein